MTSRVQKPELLIHLVKKLEIDSRIRKANGVTRTDKRELLIRLGSLLKHVMQRTETKERFSGYRYLRIRVEEIDSSADLPAIPTQEYYTFCKASEFHRLNRKLEQVTAWPGELLESQRLSVTGLVQEDGAPPTQNWLVKDKCFKQIIDRQLLGGRKDGAKQEGVLPKTAERYGQCMRSFQKSGLGEREWCKRTKVSRTTLHRAMQWYCRGRPKSST